MSEERVPNTNRANQTNKEHHAGAERQQEGTEQASLKDFPGPGEPPVCDDLDSSWVLLERGREKRPSQPNQAE